MSGPEFESPVFDEWEYSKPEEGCYRWKREDVVAEMTLRSGGWSVWIQEDGSDVVFDDEFDKQDGFRFLRNQLRAVNSDVFEE